MPIPWLTVLQSVPWSDVLSNAPKVADGAKKLWKSLGRKSPTAEHAAGGTGPAASPDNQSIATLHARLATVEAVVEDLHAQLLATSELITALAEQNAQLVARAERVRRRLRWILAALAILASVMLGSWLQTLSH